MGIPALAIAAVVAFLFLCISTASAQPIAGAHYSGSVTSAGDIDFDVSADGDEVLNLTVTDIPCDGGTHDEFIWPMPIPIVNDQFDMTLVPLATRVTGQFPAEGSAEGTFLLDLGDCQSPELPWTATAPTTPTPVPDFAVGAPAVGGFAELPDVAKGDSSTSNYVVLGGGAAAVVAVLTAGAWYATRRWGR